MTMACGNSSVASMSRLFGTNTRRARGFTIMELVIASAIALVVLSTGYLAISTTVATGNDSSMRIHEAENERLFFNMLQRDLSTAFPGPGHIRKSPREYLYQTSGYAHNANANPSPMVMTEVATNNDILQFYCRTDDPNTQDQFLFVRYYVNYKDNTLCRFGTVYDPNTVDSADLPDYSPPTLQTSVSNFNWAIFDNIHQMSITYRHWNPVTRIYEKEGVNYGAGIIDPSICDNVLITLIFNDITKQKRLEANTPKASDKVLSPTVYKANVNSTYRSYSKSISIPASFKQ